MPSSETLAISSTSVISRRPGRADQRAADQVAEHAAEPQAAREGNHQDGGREQDRQGEEHRAAFKGSGTGTLLPRRAGPVNRGPRLCVVVLKLGVRLLDQLVETGQYPAVKLGQLRIAGCGLRIWNGVAIRVEGPKC